MACLLKAFIPQNEDTIIFGRYHWQGYIASVFENITHRSQISPSYFMKRKTSKFRNLGILETRRFAVRIWYVFLQEFIS